MGAQKKGLATVCIGVCFNNIAMKNGPFINIVNIVEPCSIMALLILDHFILGVWFIYYC
jgi:hypothetical protein